MSFLEKEEKENKNNKLILIPKAEKYIQYMIEVIIKLPRIEKFSIGTEYKISMYEMLRNILLLSKIEKEKCLDKINNIDAELNTQRIYLRIMQKNRWIDNKKFNVAMELIYEQGKIIGGLIKYYAKNNKKWIW